MVNGPRLPGLDLTGAMAARVRRTWCGENARRKTIWSAQESARVVHRPENQGPWRPPPTQENPAFHHWHAAAGTVWWAVNIGGYNG
jgi:hypothetical protein